MRKVGIFLFFIMICWSYQKLQKGSFSLLMIQFPHPFEEEWKIAPLEPAEEKEVSSALLQPFSYLGKGARSIAFVSVDQQYVLKFFKDRYRKPHWTVSFLPAIEPFQSLRQKKLKKVSYHSVLSGYHHAYQQDQEGTGLLFVHLNVGKHALPEVELVDKTGQQHCIDLNQTRFVLQRKVTSLAELVDKELSTGNAKEANRRISQVVDLYFYHFEKGIHDQGVGILQNNGFCCGKPVHYDVGKMTLDPRILEPGIQYEAFRKMGEVLDQWMSKHHPDHREEILNEYYLNLSHHFAA